MTKASGVAFLASSYPTFRSWPRVPSLPVWLQPDGQFAEPVPPAAANAAAQSTDALAAVPAQASVATAGLALTLQLRPKKSGAQTQAPLRSSQVPPFAQGGSQGPAAQLGPRKGDEQVQVPVVASHLPLELQSSGQFRYWQPSP